MTKYYIDKDNKFVGGFDGDTGVVPEGSVEVALPPATAAATWDGSQWNEPAIPRDDKVQAEVVTQGVTDPLVVQALLRAVGYNDRTLLDEIIKKISDAEQKVDALENAEATPQAL